MFFLVSFQGLIILTVVVIIKSLFTSQEDLFALNRFPDDIYNIENIEMDGELSTADDDNFTSSFGKTVDNLQLKHKILAGVCVRSSSFIDNLIESLLKKLVATRDEFLVVSEQMKSLKKHMNNMEMNKQTQEQYMGTMVENLQNNLKESRTVFEKTVEERNIYQSRVCKLEADLEALEILCSEMRHKLGEHQAEERKWRERETELMSLYSHLKNQKGIILFDLKKHVNFKNLKYFVTMNLFLYSFGSYCFFRD